MVTPNYQEIVQGAIDEGVTIIQTAGRSPDSIPLADGRNLMQMLKDANMIVIHKCMSVRHALTAQRIGVEIVLDKTPTASLLRCRMSQLL